MTSILERRQSLHRQVKLHKEEQRQLAGQIESLESTASMGAAAAMIAHEINNLLTPVGNYAELALRNMDDKKLVEKALKRSRDNCKKASKVAEAILNISNGKKQPKQKVNLAELVEEVFECLCRDFSKDGITVKTDIDSLLTVFSEPVRLQQALMNLILNARDAMLQRSGMLTIKARQQGDFVVIEIKDTGCGIEPENIDKIFEPFFTTKANSQEKTGTGLGLAFCKRVIEDNGGTISVESKPQAGSTFIIKLPRQQGGERQ
ncbi:MAG: HAMP domain-containing histidine kinase [Sedimentisphaerales bacterium]|nr:HAMP domain-containing histidine kinase [Sedimentisphaerales bacterium]